MTRRDFMAGALAAAFAAASGCRRTDVRDFEVSVPEATAEDAAALRAALAPYVGVKEDSVEFDPARRVLSLRYDSMQIAKKNIEMAIAEAGFTANGVTPQSVGAKPKEAQAAPAAAAPEGKK